MSKDNQLVVIWLCVAIIFLFCAIFRIELVPIGLGIAILLTTRLRHRWFIYHA